MDSPRIAYLGPVGTYAEKAARHFAALQGWQQSRLEPRYGISTVLRALAEGDVEAAVVPVENSVEGGVTTTLDTLWTEGGLRIVRALVMPIRHALLSSGVLGGISEVISHPQALAQCSGWLTEHLPRALQLPTTSTAEAARMVHGSRFRAAIASIEAAREQDLSVLAHPINDVAGNCTRFLLLRQGRGEGPASTAAATAADNPSGPLEHYTSLAFSLHANIPGALLQALQPFADRGLSMSRIESRPSKRELGEYIFFVDLEADLSPAQLQALLADLHTLCERLLWLGSYALTDLTAMGNPDQQPGGRAGS
ncbi:MAG: prephenate dehydratase [Aphanocapsa feldmannii 277cV]|uniref:Prephenate dehydratase n=1 Tax=Aphanocapsa feldmannii 277cV TaxID=2507553 RepID=A0A524RLL3_9CHRO|nr:MAG: prephenate dehydratase [Aphanocapsa feldmannii 277cV]